MHRIEHTDGVAMIAGIRIATGFGGNFDPFVCQCQYNAGEFSIILLVGSNRRVAQNLSDTLKQLSVNVEYESGKGSYQIVIPLSRPIDTDLADQLMHEYPRWRVTIFTDANICPRCEGQKSPTSPVCSDCYKKYRRKRWEQRKKVFQIKQA